MTATAPTLDLKLRYRHGTGELANYFDGLRDGAAWGAQCPRCDRVWIPPRRTCPEDGTATEPRALSGDGRVAALTRTSMVVPFAEEATTEILVLVAMDGADNLMFGRMRDAASDIAPGGLVRLAGVEGAMPHPGAAALFEMVEGT